MQASAALVHGNDRYSNIAQALNLVEPQVSLAGCRHLVIKPNFVSTDRQLASTHVDAVRAVLDFVRPRYTGPITIAEGSALTYTMDGFDRFGYRALVDQYDVEFVDLNADQTLPVQVYDRRLRPQILRLARTIVDADFRISIGPPKTHDTVIVTLALKNMIMGSLVNRRIAARNITQQSSPPSRLVRLLGRAIERLHGPSFLKTWLHLREPSDKFAMHQGFAVMNINLALLAPLVLPQLAIIDGFQAMEGTGPVNGDPVDWKIALAGTDTLAVDTLTTSLMGFDPSEIGYLSYCRRLGLGIGDLKQINVLGSVAPDTIRRQFKPHPTYQKQRVWYMPNVDQWLQPSTRLCPVSIQH